MSHSLTAEVLVPLVLLGILCALGSVTSWTRGLQLLAVAVLFGGIIGARIGSGAIAIAFRDVFIILPLYAAFFTSRTGVAAIARLPGAIALGAIVISAYLVLSMFNTTDSSLFQLAIGIKVWIYYIPLVVVGMALAMRPDAMFQSFRTLLVCGLLVCGIGLMQAFLVRLVGYASTMTWFFGSAAVARAATQGFNYFYVAGGIYRIPGTFTFVSQYSAFLYLFLTVAMIECHADPMPRFRRIGKAAIFVALLAGLFSGSRGQLPMFAAMCAGYVFFGLMRAHLVGAALVGVPLILWIASALGVNAVSLLLFGRDLATRYAQGFIGQQIESGIQFGLFGAGIGSSTTAARYVGSGSAGALGFESYFAKIAAELGVIGLVLFGMFLLLVAVQVASLTVAHRMRSTNAIVAPLAIYIGSNLIFSLKGSPLDIDPGNMYNWLALGLIIGLHQQARLSERPQLYEPAAPPGSRPVLSGILKIGDAVT